jgi:hypothetical protein
MPEYRYMGVDLLTRQIVEDLPLYGVNLTRRISGAGNMTGSYKLGTGEFSDEDLLAATEPGLRALYVLRDNVCIWAGPIWSRTYQSQSNSIQMNGQTYESIFSRIKMQELFVQIDVDQIEILRGIFFRMQGQQNCNFGIDYTAYMPMSGVPQTTIVQAYEHKFFSEPLEDLLKGSNSFDYIIDYMVDPSDDSIDLFCKTGYPYLGYGQYGIDLDYPGAVTNYYYPESGSKGLVRATTLGQGEGTSMPIAEYTNTDLVAAGYPMWEDVRSEKQISDFGTLIGMAEETGRTFRIPVSTPTIEIKVDESIDFAEWGNFGVPINLHIQDARFPQGKDFSRRMLGWDFTPQSSENVEAIKVVLEGQE